MYNSLAFVAGLKRATDEGSLPEIAQYSPNYLPLNDFIASKRANLYILGKLTHTPKSSLLYRNYKALLKKDFILNRLFFNIIPVLFHAPKVLPAFSFWSSSMPSCRSNSLSSSIVWRAFSPNASVKSNSLLRMLLFETVLSSEKHYGIMGLPTKKRELNKSR